MDNTEFPLFGPGTHVEVRLECATVDCRVAQVHGSNLHLIVPNGARDLLVSGSAAGLRLRLYQNGRCWSAVAVSRQWVWAQTPVLVVGPIRDLQEICRRSARRKMLAVRGHIVLESGAEQTCQVCNASFSGLLLTTGEAPGIGAGDIVRLSITKSDVELVKSVPIRIIRARKIFKAQGCSLEMGAELYLPDPGERKQWEQWLTNLALGEMR